MMASPISAAPAGLVQFRRAPRTSSLSNPMPTMFSRPSSRISTEAACTEALGHLDFATAEFQDMHMQPAQERLLRHKGLLHA